MSLGFQAFDGFMGQKLEAKNLDIFLISVCNCTDISFDQFRKQIKGKNILCLTITPQGWKCNFLQQPRAKVGS